MTTPTQPAAGDVLLGCRHRPDPHRCHVFWIEGSMRFQRPDGSQGEAQWIMLCDRCAIDHAGAANKAPIACDMVWPDDAPPIVYIEPS